MNVMNVEATKSARLWRGVVSAAVCVALFQTGQAQIRTIPKEGLPGLSKETIEFEIEHNYRRENNLGLTVPAEEGTKPNSTNPQVLDGIWLQGRSYSINADGTYSEAGGFPGMAAGMAAAPGGAAGAPGAAGGPPAAPGGAAPGGAPGGGGAAAQNSCGMRLSFTMGSPSKIVQTDKVMYIFTTAGTTRRIEMTNTHPANLAPSVMGHSIGHWEGDTLVIETVGLKASRGGGGGPGGGGLSVGANSKVTERMKKIEGGLKLESMVTVEDTVSKQTSKQRVVSFYRPDLQYVEAPCEEYSDPFAEAYGNPEASAATAAKIIKEAEAAKK